MCIYMYIDYMLQISFRINMYVYVCTDMWVYVLKKKTICIRPFSSDPHFADTFPEHDNERVSWLEAQLLIDNFGQFTSEMIAVHGIGTHQNIDEIINNSDVLNSGLSTLSDFQIGLLLSNPMLLVQLQEAICLRGGGYWHKYNVDNIDSNEIARKIMNLL